MSQKHPGIDDVVLTTKRFRAARPRPAQMRAPGAWNLTRAETRVVESLAQGRRSVDIAAELRLSVHTVLVSYGETRSGTREDCPSQILPLKPCHHERRGSYPTMSSCRPAAS